MARHGIMYISEVLVEMSVVSARKCARAMPNMADMSFGAPRTA